MYSSLSKNGFHLVELLIVLAMIGILTALSLPIYSQYVVHTRRLEAARTLSKLMIAMEQYHIEHNTYQDVTLATLNFSELIVKNNYRLLIQAAHHYDYVLVAKPLGQQAEKDSRCAELTLASNGEKGITGLGKAEECW